MSAIIGAVLEMVVGGFIEAVAGKITDETWSKLQSDPARNTFKQALGAAIQRYATSGSRLDLAKPLLQEDSPLTEQSVVEELAQLVLFEREPNTNLIGGRWKTALDRPPAWRDFDHEARLLLNYLEQTLRGTEVFRPVFDAKRLDAIADNASDTVEALQNIETQLTALIDLITARFGELSHMFTNASVSIRDQIRDYTRFMEEKTRGFVGRQFVFDAVTQFTDKNPRGYLLIQGDPGIGKSALAAELVKRGGYVHHFNIRAEGINTTSAFLKNICAQLIAAYELDHTFLPPETTQDAGFFSRLLGEVSDKLTTDEKAVIVVDALDEVNTTALQPGVNPLYLPVIVPDSVYIIVTMRKDTPVKLRIDCEQDTLYIEHDADGNIADIHQYVEQSATHPKIKVYIIAQKIDDETFIAHLVTKSEGNFMYLRYVIPEIESGVYKDLNMAAIPAGLDNYYEDHWQRIRGQDQEAWLEYKLPIIEALTVVAEPVSIDLIADFSKIQELRRIRAVLQEWGQFLHEEVVDYGSGMQKRYRVYHASFHDFIARKEEVAGEHVDLIARHGQIADILWNDLFGNE